MRRISGAIALVGLLFVALPAHGAPDGSAYFISQMRDPAWNPEGPEWSANCGPACLAMAFKAYGLADPEADPQDLIRRVRRAMTGATRDQDLTSLEGIRRTAAQYGLEAGVVFGTEAVASALAAGRLVVAAGNPRAYNGRLDDRQYQAFSGAHFVLVTGMDARGYWINDPLSRIGALRIAPSELRDFMRYRGWDAGVSLGPPSQARQPLLEAQR